jgi:hypothetical protein
MTRQTRCSNIGGTQEPTKRILPTQNKTPTSFIFARTWVFCYNDIMYNWIKRWWRPTTFHVTYFTIPEWPYHDKLKYNNLDDAKKRLEYLSNLPPEDLLKEGLAIMPYYFSLLQVTSGNPIRRFINFCGSKRMYRIFGIRI